MIPLTNNSASETELRFSPGGKMIAFSSIRDGDIDKNI